MMDAPRSSISSKEPGGNRSAGRPISPGSRAAEPTRSRFSICWRDVLVAAHVKDLAPEGTKRDEEGWEVAGRGILDWRALWDSCRRHGATLMVAEHDKPRDPAQFARESFLALSGLAA